MDQADEARGGGLWVKVGADQTLFDRQIQAPEQQLAVALEDGANLELGCRVGGLLEFVEDEPRHARVGDDEFDMGPKYRGQRVQRCSGLISGGLQPFQQSFPHPAHGGEPDGALGGEVLEDRALRDADGRGDVPGGDQGWAGLSRQPQGCGHDFGLAYFGGQPRLHG